MFACDSVFSLQTCAASRVYVDELTPVDVDDEVFDTDARVSLGLIYQLSTVRLLISI